MKFILFCVTLDPSDNLTEMCIVKKLQHHYSGKYFFSNYINNPFVS